MADKGDAAAIQSAMFNVPKHCGSVFNLTFSPTEAILTVSSLMPGMNEGEIVAGIRPEAVISMSPQAAKELAVLLAQQVAIHEKTFGVMRTPFLEESEKA